VKLSDAIKKSNRQKAIGWIISLVSITLLLMSCALYLYRISENYNSIFKGVFALLNEGVVFIYQKTQFLSALWEYAPTLNYPNIFVEDNLKFAAVICTFVLGIIMRDSGIHLSNRINKVRQKAEEKIWEKSLKGEVSSRNTLIIEIPLESKDSWYSRPAGLIAISVIAGYIVNLLSKLTGISA
jgi:hypothetical protein